MTQDVSKNRGFYPKSWILIRCSIIFTIHFGVFNPPIFGSTSILKTPFLKEVVGNYLQLESGTSSANERRFLPEVLNPHLRHWAWIIQPQHVPSTQHCWKQGKTYGATLCPCKCHLEGHWNLAQAMQREATLHGLILPTAPRRRPPACGRPFQRRAPLHELCVRRWNHRPHTGSVLCSRVGAKLRCKELMRIRVAATDFAKEILWHGTWRDHFIENGHIFQNFQG